MAPADPSSLRVRFAPSPSGAVHLGSAMIALANAALARSRGGVLVLRIDDTDAARSSDQAAADLLRLLEWLGIDWQEGPVHQRDRGDIYRAALTQLEQVGAAYPCFCGDSRLDELRAEQHAAGQPSRYDGRCRALADAEVGRLLDAGAPHVLRLAVPPGRDVAFDDLVHGTIRVPAGSFGDPVLCRSDGRAGYLLASVVDDIDLAITHVVRGEDHLTNTARQLLLHEALDREGDPPRYAHLPLLRDAEGRKLSKRDPMGSLDELVDEGFLPVTIRRYLAELLGQGAVDLLVEAGDAAHDIDLGRIATGAPRVDRDRLESLGRDDMSRLSTDELLAGSGLADDDHLAPIIRELAAQSPARVHFRGELRLVVEGPGPSDYPHLLRLVDEDPLPALEIIDRTLRAAARAGGGAGPTGVGGSAVEGWADLLLASIRVDARAAGIGARGVLLPLRIALTGAPHGPALPMLLTALGPESARERVELCMGAAREASHAGGGGSAIDG